MYDTYRVGIGTRRLKTDRTCRRQINNRPVHHTFHLTYLTISRILRDLIPTIHIPHDRRNTTQPGSSTRNNTHILKRVLALFVLSIGIVVHSSNGFA